MREDVKNISMLFFSIFFLAFSFSVSYSKDDCKVSVGDLNPVNTLRIMPRSLHLLL